MRRKPCDVKPKKDGVHTKTIDSIDSITWNVQRVPCHLKLTTRQYYTSYILAHFSLRERRLLSRLLCVISLVSFELYVGCEFYLSVDNVFVYVISRIKSLAEFKSISYK